jgi:hypothetical protein
MLLDPAAPSVRVARRFVRSELVRLGRQELTEAAELGVSELSANATLHARTPYRVSVSVTGSGAVRIGVADSSPVLPDRRRHSELAGTGRGLRLLSVAGRWGVERSTDGTGKTVWFEPRVGLDETAFAEGLDPSGYAL